MYQFSIKSFDVQILTYAIAEKQVRLDHFDQILIQRHYKPLSVHGQ